MLNYQSNLIFRSIHLLNPKTMKRTLPISVITAVLTILLTGISSTLNSQGVSLKYSYPADKAVKYVMKSTMAQIMDIQGQTMQTDVSSAFGCSVKPVGIENGNITLEVTVDTLGQVTSSPMGGSGGSVAGVAGRSCKLVIAPDGKVVDLTGAEAFVYNLEGSGESNLSQTLGDFFPRLPVSAVKEGDTWNYTDSVMTKSATSSMKTTDIAECKIAGFEKVNDVECAKIVMTHTGTITMSVQAQGMDIFIKGPYTGTSECLFAVKEGYFLRQTAATLVKGTLDLPSMGMSMPITIDMKSECVGK